MNMKKYVSVFAAGLIALMLASCGNEEGDAGNTEGVEEKERIAETFIQQLADGNYNEAREQFDETMREAISETELAQTWEEIELQLGAFIEYEYQSTEVEDGFTIVLLEGLFEGQDVILSVSINENDEISGFYIH
ncbi:DUF3887 domain-containing protein [Halalkalibacter hemicellulosilyticus]|uniref:DUF3887 domain-containing protein n=1 Tax=Halalkalibacter hemicellulosilyticusJCM 9152 TaxID=1236971 RepID=W4QLU7_9BACI|nr:DUF3887 domain-containing protein [Halalkalibacter hemicellulosilyticus]GAE32613.1 hypothetical protein JCM9152_4153 [Halalkalibacter hemicellulosilyticusJCM 9152]